jgi:hypothetical protein
MCHSCLAWDVAFGFNQPNQCVVTWLIVAGVLMVLCAPYFVPPLWRMYRRRKRRKDDLDNALILRQNTDGSYVPINLDGSSGISALN